MSSSHLGKKYPETDKETWTNVKAGLVTVLKATEKALDGLPIPGVKGSVGIILQIIETADMATANVKTLQELQIRVQSLENTLLPLTKLKVVPIPDDLKTDIENLMSKLKKLGDVWKRPGKAKKHKPMLDFLRASTDKESLDAFAKGIDIAIQQFLASSATNQRIAQFKNDSKAKAMAILDNLVRAKTASFTAERGKSGGRECCEGTRIAIMNSLMQWSLSLQPDEARIFWLNGLAGIGKSTIAYTLANFLSKRGVLGGTFMFSRAQSELQDAKLVLPTLAFQLARFNHEFRSRLVEVLEEDPDYNYARIEIQFEKLIMEPLSKISIPPTHIVVLMLDAFDECEPKELTVKILELFLEHIARIPFLFRVLITTRPEPHIREPLEVANLSGCRQLVLHEVIHPQDVDPDIRIFLQVEFAKIREKYTSRNLSNWPSREELDMLAKMSGILFVYAATAIRFIGDPYVRNPQAQLNTLLDIKPDINSKVQLDKLYLEVLRNALPSDCDQDHIDRFQKVVGSIVGLCTPISMTSLSRLLEYDEEDIRSALHYLHSIIVVPQTNADPPRPCHTSFSIFIVDPIRCTHVGYVDPSKRARHLFLRCINIMMLAFRTDSEDFSDYSDPQNSTSALWYSCHYWSSHLASIAPKDVDDEVNQTLRGFLLTRVGGWSHFLLTFDKVNLRLRLDGGRLAVDQVMDNFAKAYSWVMRHQTMNPDFTALLGRACQALITTMHILQPTQPDKTASDHDDLTDATEIIVSYMITGKASWLTTLVVYKGPGLNESVNFMPQFTDLLATLCHSPNLAELFRRIISALVSTLSGPHDQNLLGLLITRLCSIMPDDIFKSWEDPHYLQLYVTVPKSAIDTLEYHLITWFGMLEKVLLDERIPASSDLPKQPAEWVVTLFTQFEEEMDSANLKRIYIDTQMELRTQQVDLAILTKLLTEMILGSNDDRLTVSITLDTD